MNQLFQKFINFKCEMNVLHGNQPITHLCVDKNCKQSIENVSSQNGKKSTGKMMSSNSILLCCKCVQSSHQNHQVISIEQFIKQAKSESKSNIYDINKQSPNYNVYEQKKNNILQCLSKISQKISNYTQLIKLKELSESSDKALNQRLITQNLQQQEFIMQRIFTLEGNNYSNQAEFEVLLKEVQEGLQKNQSVMKQYEVTKKEEDIQLKELDFIFAKLNQETQKIIQLFDRDISYHIHQKLNEYIQQSNKQAQQNNDKQSTENLNQEKNTKTLDLNAFDQISKLFSSGAKSGKNQQEQHSEQENNTQQQNITKQRLVEIQNLNPAINNNSTPTASKQNFNQNNSGGFSNLKLGNLSTAQTNSYVYSDQKLKSDNLNNKSAANSAIKGYSILSAVKCQTPQSVANENDSASINSYKKKEAPPAFSSVFPQSSSSKKISPQEKRVFIQTTNQTSNIVFVTNSQNVPANKNEDLENQKSKIQMKFQTDSLNFDNFTPKLSENSSKIKNIGGNLSPISKPQNAEDELHQTAKEIIQENNIEWLDNEDYDLIDRGQFLAKERRQIGQEDFNLKKLGQQDDEEEDDDNVTLYDNEDYDSNDFLEKDEDLIQFGEEIYEQDKENNNQQSFYRQNYNKCGQNLNLNGFQSSAQKSFQTLQNEGQSQIQQTYGQEVDRKKEKRLRKRLSKKLKKLRQQHDLIEQEQMQLKLKQVEEEKKLSMIKLNDVNPDQSSSVKQFQYSSCNPANKKGQFKGTNSQLQNSAEKGKQQQLSDTKFNKESNFQNLLSQMKSNQQQNLNKQSSNINQPNLLKDSLGYNQKTGIYSSKILNTAISPNKQEAVQQFERDQSPDLQHFSNGITINQTKKKLKTNQIYEGAYTNSELKSQQYNFNQNQIVKNNNFGINQMKNNIHSQFEYEQKSQNNNSKFEGSQESQSFQQSMSAFQSQNSTLSNKKDLSLINLQMKTSNIQNSQQQSQVYNNFNNQRHFNNTQFQYNQYQNPNLQQPNNYNTLLSDVNLNNNNQQRHGRYSERFQSEFSQSQLKIQNNFQSSQDPFQVPQKPNQQSVIARHNSLIRPYQQNYQSAYNQKQNSLDTSTPFEEQININSSKQSLNFRNTNTSSKNTNYSNPHTFMQNDERVLNKSKIQQPQQQDCVNNFKLQSEISQGLEQIQQQIEFSNSLREQLERKIREEQQNSDKYQQSSSTKRLKFQIIDDEPQNSKHNNYLKSYENQIYNPIERSYQIDNVSSLDEQNQSQYDDQSPLYSPIVQFSPMESDEIS
ncbi:hypothetical protein TTHERM_00919670 (macronuclear) [Tetrahymena thermophila SB210]|uniref:Uncharacterized protein n=1 Tax=Tetrahymena thermophila (strain SB210) TaxID=312017 RepID=Q24IK7_TETTS|nr:hypothetical protein TTHERM_00919670 [Tetrahymena thermophila SB210]EAS07618.2 hypothetical protein TTHERM_00919670 [Tetrahymena thermophila SB210]|eukprot:XP_001027860.2 hypothetical protein TTHERM_00919670 [Tetrahymena thermophila SB210]